MEYNLKHYAHIGDAVWELYVREFAINYAKDQKKLHEITTKNVCATYQAEIFEKIKDNLTEDEKELAKRARNLAITINKRSNPQIHRIATSLEVLIGFWYLNEKEKLNSFFSNVKKYLKK